jgi:hypothetical protein
MLGYRRPLEEWGRPIHPAEVAELWALYVLARRLCQVFVFREITTTQLSRRCDVREIQTGTIEGGIETRQKMHQGGLENLVCSSSSPRGCKGAMIGNAPDRAVRILTASRRDQQ